MKWYSVITTALSAAQFLGAVEAASAGTCKTYYTSAPVTKVSTTTTTQTQTVTYATVITTVTRTSTRPAYTFTTSIGNTTTTIPTGSSFTPIISAAALPGVSTKRRRDVVVPRNQQKREIGKRAPQSSAAKSKSYAHSVVCGSTVTTTVQNTTPYSTVIVSRTQGVYATSTTYVATATVHAACEGSDNLITAYKGNELSGIDAERNYDICNYSGGSGPSGIHSGNYACMDARSCCEVAQDYFSGYRFDNATGQNRCMVLFGSYVASGQWVFYEGENENDFFFGNGAYGGGAYGGVNPEPGCSGGGTGCSS